VISLGVKRDRTLLREFLSFFNHDGAVEEQNGSVSFCFTKYNLLSISGYETKYNLTVNFRVSNDRWYIIN
jgi:hypothetical protein